MTLASTTPIIVESANPTKIIGYTFAPVSGPYILADTVGKML